MVAVACSGCQAPLQPKLKSESLSLSDKASLIRMAYAVFDEDAEEPGHPTSSQPPLTPTAFAYHLVCVDLYEPQGRRLGSGFSEAKSESLDAPRGLAVDVQAAARRARRSMRKAKAAPEAPPDTWRVIVHLLHKKRRVKPNTLDVLTREIEPGIHAIELREGERRAIVDESEPIRNNHSLERVLAQLSLAAGLRSGAYLAPETELFVYETATFMGDRSGRLVDLLRFNRLLPVSAVSRPLIRERLELAGAWFRESFNPTTGLLEYQYDPAKDAYSRNDNHIRRLASLWAMAKLARFSGEEAAYRPMIRSMLDHYLGYVRLDEEGGRVVEIDPRSPIAYGAFLILTLSEWEDYPSRLETIRELAEGILHQQVESGAYRTLVGEPGIHHGIDYYSGESMLALMSAYRLLREPAYLSSVERAFPYYQAYWRARPTTAFVPWHAQVNRRLYEETSDPRYAAFAFELADWLISHHQIRSPRRADEEGGFITGRHREPRNSTSSYMEGVNAAYQLARLVRDEPRRVRYARSIRLGTRFILQTQYTPENVFYLKNPKRALGGFTQSLIRTFERIDYTQHAVMALLAAYESDLFSDERTSP